MAECNAFLCQIIDEYLDMLFRIAFLHTKTRVMPRMALSSPPLPISCPTLKNRLGTYTTPTIIAAKKYRPGRNHWHEGLCMNCIGIAGLIRHS